MFLNLVVNLSLECPTVLDLAGGEKEFNNRAIGYFFFFFPGSLTFGLLSA